MDPQEQIDELRAKLQAKQAQYEQYQAECKKLEEFLQEQSQKKTQEIMKLKQQAIMKDKETNFLKNQVNQLNAQVTSLKQQLSTFEKASSGVPSNEEMQQMKTNFILQQKKLQEKQELIQKQIESIKNLELALKQRQNQLSNSITECSQLKQELKDSQKHNEILQKKLKNLQEDGEKIAQQFEQQKSIENSYKELQQQFSKLTHRFNVLQEENKMLKVQLNKYKQLSQKKSHHEIPSPSKRHLTSPISIKMQQAESENNLNGKNNMSPWTCSILMTKPHYISPFLQIKDSNLLKLYKQSKNGFEKSMGAIKFKMDLITYEAKAAIQQCIANLQGPKSEQIQFCTPDSIFIFGVKKSSKKYIMANLIQRLSDFIMNKVEKAIQNSINVEVVFMKRALEEQKNQTIIAHTKEQINELILRVMQLGQKSASTKSPSKVIGKSKIMSKPKIRYFAVKIGEYVLEIITSSHTNQPLRQTLSFQDALNISIYNKSSDLLQLAFANRQVILTLNPIVNFYDDCKNCLTLSACKQSHNASDDQAQTSGIQVQHYMNNQIKKQVQLAMKETEQQTIRSRKMQQQCHFYRQKFEDLELRLKSLLSTHNAQNSYLKKSPTTVNFQKLLKFVHSVLAKRTTSSLNIQQHPMVATESDQEPL